MKTIPKTERPWETIVGESGDIYYITSKLNDRAFYFIYKQGEEAVVKLGRDKNPMVLEQKYVR